MTEVDPDVPDRWFVTLRGRTGADHDFDVVSLIVTERDDTAGLGPEEARIVALCGTPLAVAELSSLLRVPLGMVCVLLSGLLDRGYVTARHPYPHPPLARTASPPIWEPPDSADLERVLDGLRKL